MKTNISPNNKTLNLTFNILNFVWIGFSLFTIFFVLACVLAMKEQYAAVNGNPAGNIGLATIYSNYSTVNGLGAASIALTAISLLSAIALIVCHYIFQPAGIAKSYFSWTVGIILAGLIFTFIIAMLGQWWTGYNGDPIIGNMLSKKTVNNETVYSLDGGSISILLVDIVIFCLLIVTVTHLIIRFVKLHKANYVIENNQENLNA